MFKKNSLKSIIILIILILSLSVPSFASSPTDLLNPIQVKNKEGKELKNLNNFIRSSLTPITSAVEFSRSATWGDLLNNVESFDISPDIISQLGNKEKSLIMNKSELYEYLKILIELKSNSKLNTSSSNLFMTGLQAYNTNKNYITLKDLTDIINRDLKVSSEGVLAEVFTGKITKLSGSLAEVQRIYGTELKNDKYLLDTKTPWKHENKIYSFRVEGSSIVELEPKYEIQYSIASKKDSVTYLDETPTLGNVSAGELVEYSVLNDNALVLNNYGTFDGSYVVKSLEGTKLTTYEGLTFDKDTKIIDKQGIEVNPKTLNRNIIVSKFGDFIINHSNTNSSQIRYTDPYVYIDNVRYLAKDIYISDGGTYQLIKDFPNMEYISQGDVVWDILDNPKLIKTSKVQYIVDVRDTSKGVIKGVYNGGTIENNLIWTYNSANIRPGYVYNLVIIEDEVVEATRLKQERTLLTRLYDNYFYTGGSRIYTDDNTLVIVQSTEETTGKINYKETSYSEFISTYQESMKKGYMIVDFYYNTNRTVAEMLRVNIMPTEGVVVKKLKTTPLDLYRIVSINKYNNDTVRITLSDNETSALFIADYPEMVEGLKVGQYVEVHFSGTENIGAIYTFGFDEDNILTPNLSNYMNLMTIIKHTETVKKGSDKESELRASYPFYKEINGTLVPVLNVEDLVIGNTYIAMKSDELYKIRITR